MSRNYPNLTYADLDKTIEQLLCTILQELRELREKVEQMEVKHNEVLPQ